MRNWQVPLWTGNITFENIRLSQFFSKLLQPSKVYMNMVAGTFKNTDFSVVG